MYCSTRRRKDIYDQEDILDPNETFTVPSSHSPSSKYQQALRGYTGFIPQVIPPTKATTSRSRSGGLDVDVRDPSSYDRVTRGDRPASGGIESWDERLSPSYRRVMIRGYSGHLNQTLDVCGRPLIPSIQQQKQTQQQRQQQEEQEWGEEEEGAEVQEDAHRRRPSSAAATQSQRGGGGTYFPSPTSHHRPSITHISTTVHPSSHTITHSPFPDTMTPQQTQTLPTQQTQLPSSPFFSHQHRPSSASASSSSHGDAGGGHGRDGRGHGRDGDGGGDGRGRDGDGRGRDGDGRGRDGDGRGRDGDGRGRDGDGRGSGDERRPSSTSSHLHHIHPPPPLSSSSSNLDLKKIEQSFLGSSFTNFRTYGRGMELEERYTNAIRTLFHRHQQTQAMLLRMIQCKLSENINTFAEQYCRSKKIFEYFDLDARYEMRERRGRGRGEVLLPPFTLL
jgi:hypothetical protein